MLGDRRRQQGHVEDLPRAWKRPDPKMRYNVLFLRHEIDSESIIDGLAPKPGDKERYKLQEMLNFEAALAKADWMRVRPSSSTRR